MLARLGVARVGICRALCHKPFMRATLQESWTSLKTVLADQQTGSGTVPKLYGKPFVITRDPHCPALLVS